MFDGGQSCRLCSLVAGQVAMTVPQLAALLQQFRRMLENCRALFRPEDGDLDQQHGLLLNIADFIRRASWCSLALIGGRGHGNSFQQNEPGRVTGLSIHPFNAHVCELSP